MMKCARSRLRLSKLKRMTRRIKRTKTARKFANIVGVVANQSQTQKQQKHPKVQKVAKKSTRRKAKKQLKRARNDEESNGRKVAKKRRLSDESESVVISSNNVNDFIAETMSTKECKVIFDEMIRRGEVKCTVDGNWCNIGKCAEVKKRFGKKCHLKRHVDEEHIGRRFRCTFPHCSYDGAGKRFRQKGPAKEHINNTHFKAESLWKCCFCGDTFSRWNGVKRHLVLKRCKYLKLSCSDEKKQEIVNKAKSGELQSKCKNF